MSHEHLNSSIVNFSNWKEKQDVRGSADSFPTKLFPHTIEQLNQINKRLLDFPNTKDELSPGIFVIKNDIMTTLLATNTGLRGIGRNNAFYRQSHAIFDESTFITSPPINSAIEIELHTDEKTTDQVNNLVLQNPEIIDLLSTIYRIEEDVITEKIVFLPSGIHDTRPTRMESYLPRRVVSGDMNSEDLTMINAVVTLFEENLRG